MTMTDKTATEFINLLGGSAKVATMLGVKQNVVGNWLARGIPLVQVLNLVRIAKAKRKPIPQVYKDMLP